VFKNVLVGVDGHLGGEDAVALARRLTAQHGQLTLAHVYSGDQRLWRGSQLDHEAARQRQAAELLSAVRERAGVHALLRCAESSSPGRGLHELAEAMAADLLVVGSSRRGQVGRVFLGDDTLGALNGAPCAVAIAPAAYSQRSAVIDKIGVAYDGSAESRHAVFVAGQLAQEDDLTLCVCEVVTLPAYTFVAGAAPIEDAIDDLLGQARERLEALGDVEAHAVYGNAVAELARYSGSVDLLLVGSRGYGPFGRLVHGSTSNQLARTALCPLLVLTRGAHPVENADARPAGVGADASERG
jgi:nucleotide-binding universal stress UspA family protein